MSDPIFNLIINPLAIITQFTVKGRIYNGQYVVWNGSGTVIVSL